MTMPAEFCFPDDELSEEDQAAREVQQVLDATHGYIEHLMVSRYQAAEAYQRAMRSLSAAKGIPRLERQYTIQRDNAIAHMRWIKSRIDANLS
jgi:hypothetical protein